MPNTYTKAADLSVTNGKIDAVKVDTADIRTDVTAIHDTDLPAVKVDTADIRSDVTAIHDTDLPAVKTDTADIRSDVTTIHDTDLPAVKTDTADIRSDVTTIHDTDLPAAKTVVDAVKVTTDKLDPRIPVSGTLKLSSQSDVTAITASDVLLHSNDAETIDDNAAYTKVKEIEITVAGTYRVTFELKNNTGSYNTWCKIYKNGVAHGTERTNSTTSYIEYSEDLVFAVDDLIQLYTQNIIGTNDACVKNFRIHGDCVHQFWNNTV